MTQSLFIGVDGGATKCIVSVEDETGKLLGREISGPANIRISPSQAWDSINTALDKILNPLGVTSDYLLYAGMGLAGCEVQEAYQAFLEQSPQFETLVISSDAHIACLGAHGGQDGSIIIIGTGVVGFQVELDQTTKVGGWGFPHDDIGGGAWLGLEAVKATLQALDGRTQVSNLAKAIYAHFDEDFDRFVTWSNQANSTAFAELAPLVIQLSKANDPVAIQLLKKAAQSINQISKALKDTQSKRKERLPCALVGSIAPFVEPFLDNKLRDRLVPCQFTPDAGAVLMLRDYLANPVGDCEDCGSSHD